METLRQRTFGYGQRPDAQVASFDVFDTLLVRATGGPEAHFVRLGHEIVGRFGLEASPERVARLRRRIERSEVDRVGGVTGVRLHAVMQRMAGALGIPDQVDALCRLEVQLECEICRPSPIGVAALRRAREAGSRILFLSDTYYSESELTELLAAHGLHQPGDLVIASSAGVGSKHDSRLYAVAATALGVPPVHVHHVGNDARSDGRQAARQEIAFTLLTEGNFNRFELILDTHRRATAMTRGLAGASRLARLELAAAQRPDPSLDAVSCGVGGPLVAGYLLWTLFAAHADGIRRLLFVSREGVLLAELAAQLAARAGLTIECRYVPGGRAAWTAGALDPDSLQERAHLLVDGSRPFSAATALQRLALDPGILEDLLAQLPLALRGEVSRDEAQRVGFVRELLGVDAVRTAVAERSQEVRSDTRRWFAQEGLFDGVPTGLVDPGCGATLLQLLRAQCGDRLGELPGYYLGARPGTMMWLGPAPRLWLFDRAGLAEDPHWEPEPISQRWSWPFITTFEMVTAAAFGSMTGYGVDVATNRLESRHDPESIPAVRQWGLDRVQDGIRSVVRQLPFELLDDPAADTRRPLAEALRAFFLHPTYDEARRWGSFPLEDGWGGALTWQPFGAPVRLASLRHGPRRALKPHRLHWIHGSLTATDRRVGPLLASAWDRLGITT